MLSFFTDPFSSDFMVRAAIGAVTLGIAAPLCGCWLTQRRLVYLADAMSHAILAGVAGAALFGASLVAGAFVAAIVMALCVVVLVLRAGIAQDSAIGVTGQGLLALGVIGVSLQSDPRSLTHVLFGNPLTVGWSDVVVQSVLALVVVAAAWFLFPVLLSTTFDATHAKTVGIRVGIVDAVLVTGLGLVVVIGLTTVGVLMAVSMTIAPAVAASLLTKRMATMLPVSVALGITAGLLGLLISYHASLPSGPAIALCAVAEVIIAALITMVPNRLARTVVVDRPELSGHH